MADTRSSVMSDATESREPGEPQEPASPHNPSVVMLSDELSQQVTQEEASQLFRDLVRVVVHDAPWESALRPVEAEAMLNRICQVLRHRSTDLNKEEWVRGALRDIRRERRTQSLCITYATFVARLTDVCGPNSVDLFRRPTNFPNMSSAIEWHKACEDLCRMRLNMANERGSKEHAQYELEQRVFNAVSRGDAKRQTVRLRAVDNPTMLITGESCFGGRLSVAVHYVCSYINPGTAVESASRHSPSVLQLTLEIVEMEAGGASHGHGEIAVSVATAWHTDPYAGALEPDNLHASVRVPGKSLQRGESVTSDTDIPGRAKRAQLARNAAVEANGGSLTPEQWWKPQHVTTDESAAAANQALGHTAVVDHSMRVQTLLLGDHVESVPPPADSTLLVLRAREMEEPGCCGTNTAKNMKGQVFMEIRVPLGTILYEEILGLGTNGRYLEPDTTVHFFRGLFRDAASPFGAYISVGMRCNCEDHHIPMPAVPREEFAKVDDTLLAPMSEEMDRSWATVNRHQLLARLMDMFGDLTDMDVELMERYVSRYLIHEEWASAVLKCAVARRARFTTEDACVDVYNAMITLIELARKKTTTYQTQGLISDTAAALASRLITTLVAFEELGVEDPRKAEKIATRCMLIFDALHAASSDINLKVQSGVVEIQEAIRATVNEFKEDLDNELNTASRKAKTVAKQRVARAGAQGGAAAAAGRVPEQSVAEAVEHAATIQKYVDMLLGRSCAALDAAMHAFDGLQPNQLPPGGKSLLASIASARVAEAGECVVEPLSAKVPLIIGVAAQLRGDARQDELVSAISTLLLKVMTYAQQLSRYQEHADLAARLFEPFQGFAMSWLAVCPDQADRWVTAIGGMPLVPINRMLPADAENCFRVCSLSVGHFRQAVSELTKVFAGVVCVTDWHEAASSATRFANLVCDLTSSFLEKVGRTASLTTGQHALANGHCPTAAASPSASSTRTPRACRWVELIVAVTNLHMIPQCFAELWADELLPAVDLAIDQRLAHDDQFLADRELQAMIQGMQHKTVHAMLEDILSRRGGVQVFKLYESYFIDDTITGFIRRSLIKQLIDDYPRECAKPQQLTGGMVESSASYVCRWIFEPLKFAVPTEPELFSVVVAYVAEALADVVCVIIMNEPLPDDVSASWCLDVADAVRRAMERELRAAHLLDDSQPTSSPGEPAFTPTPLTRFNDRVMMAQRLRQMQTSTLLERAREGAKIGDRVIPLTQYILDVVNCAKQGEAPRGTKFDIMLMCVAQRAQRADRAATSFCVDNSLRHVPFHQTLATAARRSQIMWTTTELDKIADGPALPATPRRSDEYMSGWIKAGTARLKRESGAPPSSSAAGP